MSPLMQESSTGWVVAFVSALTYFGALPIDTQAEIHRDGTDVVNSGGVFPLPARPWWMVATSCADGGSSPAAACGGLHRCRTGR